MANDYVITTNESGDLAVRTVSATEASNITDTLSVITRTDDGKLAVRTVGGSGGDAHNKGYFATLAELQEAYPTGEAGDWAIVAESDTVYIWDATQQAWVDTDQKGQVTSVNGQTGDVTLTIPEAVQYDTMPTASADNLGDIVQFTGTTDANYTNGYFYKCTSAGDPAVYSWTQVDVQPAGVTSVNGQTGDVVLDLLPTQTGNAGKFLTTDGTDASWSDKPLVNTATYPTSNINIGNTSAGGLSGNTTIGLAASCGPLIYDSVSVGSNTRISSYSVVVGSRSRAQNGSISIGYGAENTGAKSILLSADATSGTFVQNTEANTFKINIGTGSTITVVGSDGKIPTDTMTKVNTTATLAVADWSSSTQTVTVSGVKADSVVFVSPAPASASDYASAGILCTAQAADSLTFTCTTTPSNAITVNVICM